MNERVTRIRLPRSLPVCRFGGRTSAVLSGDPEFDARVCATGEPAEVAGLLTAEVRRLLVRLVPAGLVELAGHDLLWRGRASVRGTAERLAEALGSLPADRTGRLLAQVRDEPLEPVRRNCAELLASSPESPEALIGVLLEDPAMELRILGASLAGRDDPAAIQVWRESLAGCDPAIRRRALLLLAGRGRDDLVPDLVAMLPEADPGASRLLAEVLTDLDHPDCAEALLELLRHPSAEVAVAAARGLGRHGDVEVIEPLLSRRGPTELRAACRRAVRRIQARIPGAGPGQLSRVRGGGLSEVEAGRLTLSSS